MNICDQMLDWLRERQRDSDIDAWHFVQNSAPASKGISHSMLLALRPAAPGRRQYMSTSLALDAIRTFRGLVARYGALHGGFQIWEDGYCKGDSHVSIIEWPPVRAVAGQ